MASSGNTNPGNFANRPQEEVEDIARKGGQSSHTGGFHNMDPDKQVHRFRFPRGCFPPLFISLPLINWVCFREKSPPRVVRRPAAHFNPATQRPERLVVKEDRAPAVKKRRWKKPICQRSKARLRRPAEALRIRIYDSGTSSLFSEVWWSRRLYSSIFLICIQLSSKRGDSIG
jgi:Stress-induced bacterial acidophilic repeat motif